MKLPAKVLHWDDERSMGNSLIVSLKPGWKWGQDPFQAEHVLGFDTAREARAALKSVIKCNCAECAKGLE